MPLDDFICPLSKVESLEKWISKDVDDDSCPPCTITPLASYYLGVLEDAGEAKLAEELQQVYSEGDLLTIARKMDKIKAEVGGNLKSDLKKLDCFAQVHKGKQDADV